MFGVIQKYRKHTSGFSGNMTQKHNFKLESNVRLTSEISVSEEIHSLTIFS